MVFLFISYFHAISTHDWVNHGLAMKRSDKELQNEWSRKFVAFFVWKWSNVTLDWTILGNERISDFSAIQNEVADFKCLSFLNDFCVATRYC